MLAWFCTGWVAGCLLIHQLDTLPNAGHCLWAALGWLAATVLTRKCHVLAWILIAICGVSTGGAWTAWSASNRLADALDPALEGYVTRVTWTVSSIAKSDAHGQQFDAVRVGDGPLGVPRHLVIHWPASASASSLPNHSSPVLPGQVWQAALMLKRPRSKMNPHLFDNEAHQFARGIRAIGTVRGQPTLIRDDPWSSVNAVVQRARHHIRAGMQRVIGDRRYGAVLIALAVGDQHGVHADDWRIFNLAGITHLVSISGSHVTLMAALIAKLCLIVWKRAVWQGVAISSRIPAKTAAGCVAMVCALLYCLLAGWGVPAQRTFFMLLVAWLAWTSRLRLSAHQVLSLAGTVVCLLDPWSVMSTGFWLSFGAVCVLWIASQSSMRSRMASRNQLLRHWHALLAATKLQWVISLSLMPVLCWLFQQVSLASPLANALAIPVVTLLVTPASLMLAALSMIEPISIAAKGLAWFVHLAFEWMMVPVSTLATAKWALLEMPAFPVSLLIVSCLGLGWSLQPCGVPARWMGWLWMSVAFCWTPDRPRDGDWHLLALDVGQASSILIMTSQQAMLFDAGGRSASGDDGQRIVLPLLRALGIHTLDGIVISHEDRDHVGGLSSILAAVNVDKLVGVNNLRSIDSKSGVLSRIPCQRGLKWVMDGVRFEVLHPEADPSHATVPPIKGKRNHLSCVLIVTGRYHSVLLPGDITVREEAKLLANGAPRADVVLAPHHGSDTSSSLPWVRATGAQQVIIQSGWRNRFGHPSQHVVARWQGAGARVWRTDQQGAIWVSSQKTGLHIRSTRKTRRRYWHFED